MTNPRSDFTKVLKQCFYPAVFVQLFNKCTYQVIYLILITEERQRIFHRRYIRYRLLWLTGPLPFYPTPSLEFIISIKKKGLWFPCISFISSVIHLVLSIFPLWSIYIHIELWGILSLMVFMELKWQKVAFLWFVFWPGRRWLDWMIVFFVEFYHHIYFVVKSYLILSLPYFMVI